MSSVTNDPIAVPREHMARGASALVAVLSATLAAAVPLHIVWMLPGRGSGCRPALRPSILGSVVPRSPSVGTRQRRSLSELRLKQNVKYAINVDV